MIATVRRLALAALVLALPAIAGAQTYTISPPPFLLAQNNSGAIINNACIWTYTAGTTTPATTYTTSTGTANSNPIRSDSAGRFTAYLSPGSSYKFVYESACVPPAHGSVLRTADNISAMPSASGVVDITGTAGESITAGQVVYLSAGDGSKTPAQWYKADSANAYSSTTNWVGLATVNIASAGTGTIRIAGQVTGLTVTGGTTYYVGTAGALTATAPANNVRKLGEADSATTLVLKDRDAPQLPFVDDFRLSLTTATCVPSSDVTGASAVTIYLTPCTGNRITLFDTSGNQETCTTAEVSIAVPATTSQMYDVWAYDSTFGTCTVTLELLAWTNDTTRATATTKTSGSNWRYTKSGNTSRMYLGSFRTTTVSGQTEDSLAKRQLCSYYNRVPRSVSRVDPTANWAYTTSTVRQARGSTANQVAVVQCQAETPIDLTLIAGAGNTQADVTVSAGIGEDSTTTYTVGAIAVTATADANVVFPLVSRLAKTPAAGYHFYSWNEWSAAAGATSWTGGTSAGSSVTFGLAGTVWD